MAREGLWTVVRCHDGSWTSGGTPADYKDYVDHEVFQVLATDRDSAVKKAKAERCKAQRSALAAKRSREAEVAASIEPDACAYIRETHSVPAKVGMRVEIHFRLSGMANQTGVIKGADDWLFVLMDGEKKPRRFSPINLITYFNEDGTVAAEFGDD